MELFLYNLIKAQMIILEIELSRTSHVYPEWQTNYGRWKACHMAIVDEQNITHQCWDEVLGGYGKRRSL